jgi:hypothetical protein
VVVLRSFLVCVGLVSTIDLAVANPAQATAAERYKQAAHFAADDEYEKALVALDEGLAAAPKDLQLLGLKGTVLLKMRDYAGALGVYEAYLEAGVRGGNRREAQKIVNLLRAAKSTSIEIDVANGPATIYLDTRSQGAFCQAAPSCRRSLLPGDYKVIVERAGFEKFTQRVTVANGQVAELAVTLVEKPSLVTVRAATPTGAAGSILIDGAPYDEPRTVPAGPHEVVAGKVGFGTVRQKVVATGGAAVELDITLQPLVPIQVEPRGAELFVDGNAVELEDGGIPVPAGAHTLTARAAGFHELRQPIAASRGAEFRIDVALAPVGALLELANAPRGAQVVIDGKVAGTAPLTTPVEISPGARTVELRIDGFRAIRLRERFATDQRVKLEVGKLRVDSRRRTYLTGAATGALLLTGAAFSYAALDRESAYNQRARLAGVTADDGQLAEMRSSGRRFSVFADIGLGLGVVGLGATTYFFLREGRGQSEGTLKFGVGPATATLSGTF